MTHECSQMGKSKVLLLQLMKCKVTMLENYIRLLRAAKLHVYIGCGYMGVLFIVVVQASIYMQCYC